MPTNRPLRPWLAALFSLMGGPIGHVYAGALRRCAVLWFIGVWMTLSSVVLALFSSKSVMSCVPLVAATMCYPLLVAVDAFRTARRRRNNDKRSYQRWWVYLLFGIAFLIFNSAFAELLKSQIAEAFVVPSCGMAKTILAGERILMNKLHYHFNEIKRGDVVVFAIQGPGSELWIQRVVGTAGDQVEVRDESVYLNGAKLDEPYAFIDIQLPKDVRLSHYGPARIPNGHLFLLGDNRRLSMDSRMIGFIPLSSVMATAEMVYWPRERIFPDPSDSERFELGPFHWDRFGKKIE